MSATGHRGFESLVDVARRRCAEDPERPAYSFLADGRTPAAALSRGPLDAQVRALAAAIQDRTVRGARVLIAVPPGLDFVRAAYACLYAGAVTVPAAVPAAGRLRRSLPRLRHMVREAGIGLALGGDREQIAAMAAAAPDLGALDWICLRHPPADAAAAWRPPAIAPDDLAALQFTSGSIADPKGVMVSHGNLIANLRALRRLLCAGFEVEGVMWVPPYHDMGLVGGIFLALFNGHHVTLISPAYFLRRPLSWLETISRSRATHTAAPNFALELCVERSDAAQRAGLDLACLRMLLSGGEPVNPRTIARFAAAFAPAGFDARAITPAYGLAESTLIATAVPVRSAPRTLALDAKALRRDRVALALDAAAATPTLVGCGRPVPGTRLEIVDPATLRPLGAGRIGEIWLQGPSIAGGYWNRAADGRETFGARLAGRDEEPFLRTGDLGFLEDGELFVAGRLKDMLIVHGQNHHPQDIERSVEAAHPALIGNGSAAFGLAENGAERLVVVAEAQQGAPARELVDAVREAVGAQHDLALSRLVLIRRASLPRTTSGKVRRSETRRRLLAGGLAVLHDWSAPHAAPPCEPMPIGESSTGAVVAWLLHEVAGISGHAADQLEPGTPLARSGLSSVDVADLLQRTELRYGVVLPLEELSPEATLGELAEVVAAACAPEAAARAGAPRAAAASEDGIGGAALAAIRGRIRALAEQGIENPFFPVHDATARSTTRIGGRELINFASYNYLALSGHPEVNAAAKAAVDEFGTSVSASRLVSGERPLHRRLERALARFTGTEDCLALVSGNLTNVTVIGHLVGPGDLILHDALAHDSILQGAKLSGAARRAFPHNDAAALERLLAALAPRHRRVLIVVEGVYWMDGDIPDLRRLVAAKRRHGAWLMVDEAHSIGTLGRHGRGLAEHAGVDPDAVEIWMGTLSKSFASCGGYIAGSGELIEYLKYSAPGFVFSVGLPPANAAAALAALRLIEAEPDRVIRLQAGAELFLRLARAARLDTGSSADSPVIPVILGDSELAIACSAGMRARGVNVQPIVYPAVEENAARLRFFVCADHSDRQIRTTVAALGEVTDELRSRPAAPALAALRSQAAGAAP